MRRKRCLPVAKTNPSRSRAGTREARSTRRRKRTTSKAVFTEFIFDTSYGVARGICESHVHMGRTRPSRCLCVVRAKGSHGPAEAADPVGILVVVVIVVIVVVDVASEEICEGAAELSLQHLL